MTCPGKRWLEDKLNESRKTVFFISHDRELLNNAAGRIVTLEPGINGAGAWIHGGGFGSYVDARADRNARFEELRKRWDEEHVKLKELVNMYKNKAAFRSDMANRYHAAQTRLAKFLEVGSARGAAHRAERADAAQGRPDRQARHRGGEAGTDRADEAVLHRGLVRRPRGCAGLQRLGQVATSCGCLPPAAPIRSGSTCPCPTSKSPKCRTRAP